MKLIPSTLFARSALLIALLIIVSQITTSVLFLYWVQKPRLLAMLEIAESNLQSVRVALALLPEEKRNLYLEQVSQNSGLKLQRQAPKIEDGDDKPPFVIKRFLRLFERRLNPNERLIYQTSPEKAVWVQVYVDQKPYWARFSVSPFSHGLSELWLRLGILMVLLALFGGLIIHRTLKKPLQRLLTVVSRIGAGQRTDPIVEEGPDEIVSFIHALNRMSADLKAMETDRTFMLAGISHDLRTPITRIQLAIEMIGGDFDTALKDQVLDNLAEIENGLRQCLDFARDSADEPKQFADLNDLATLCAASYTAHGQFIALDLCEDAQAFIRPFAIERLLKNLLNNAFKYAKKDIAIVTGRDHNQLFLSVLDRGPGIAQAEIDNLRRPFARATKARSGAAGYGLGLAIVDKIVEAHQARIEFLQREGGGLEVRVSFVTQL